VFAPLVPHRPRRLVAAVVLAAVILGACSDDGDDSASGTPTTIKPPLETRDTTWLDWNNAAAARGFTTEANAVAARVAKDIAAGGVACKNFEDTTFDFIATTYYRQGIPIPLGSGECEGPGAKGNEENILIEVLGPSAPTARDFVTSKRNLLCQQAKDDFREPDGTSSFPGIPFVMAPDETWVVQPDSFEVNREIAGALDVESRDMCEGIT
jgi:hypothetical protein